MTPRTTMTAAITAHVKIRPLRFLRAAASASAGPCPSTLGRPVSVVCWLMVLEGCRWGASGLPWRGNGSLPRWVSGCIDANLNKRSRRRPKWCSGGGGHGWHRHVQRGGDGPEELRLLGEDDPVRTDDMGRGHQQALLDRAARAGEPVEGCVE